MSEAEKERAAIVAWGLRFAESMEQDFASKLAKIPAWERESAKAIYDMGISTIRLVIGGIEKGRHSA